MPVYHIVIYGVHKNSEGKEFERTKERVVELNAFSKVVKKAKDIAKNWLKSNLSRENIVKIDRIKIFIASPVFDERCNYIRSDQLERFGE